jgi:hypothetical protein
MVNDRAKELRDFFTFMLGTTETSPLVVGETPVNGATINALLDCFKTCYPEPKPERPPRVGSEPERDPLGLLAPRTQ